MPEYDISFRIGEQRWCSSCTACLHPCECNYRGLWYYKTTSPRNWNTASVRDGHKDLTRLGPLIDEGV